MADTEEFVSIESFSKTCPVKVGDYFYRERPHETLPDRLEVLEITDNGDDFLIRGKYIYHAIGPTFERVFSSKIFNDPSWIIEKKGARN